MGFTKRTHLGGLLFLLLLLFTVMVVTSGTLTGNVIATPTRPTPNSWVKLDCWFNLAEKHTTLVFWQDDFGDSLYLYEKGTTPEVNYGSKYTGNGESGLVRDVVTEPGHQSVMLLIRCNNSPYTCYIWNQTIQLEKPLNIELNGTPGPLVTVDGRDVRSLTVEQSATHRFSCQISDATEPHELTINVAINMVHRNDARGQSTEDSRRCSYSSHVEQTYSLQAGDEVAVNCRVQYESGQTHDTSIATCGGRPPQERTNCGLHYSTEQQCYDAGCCWDSSVGGVTLCFRYTTTTVTTVSSPTTTEAIPVTTTEPMWTTKDTLGITTGPMTPTEATSSTIPGGKDSTSSEHSPLNITTLAMIVAFVLVILIGISAVIIIVIWYRKKHITPKSSEEVGDKLGELATISYPSKHGKDACESINSLKQDVKDDFGPYEKLNLDGVGRYGKIKQEVREKKSHYQSLKPNEPTENVAGYEEISCGSIYEEIKE